MFLKGNPGFGLENGEEGVCRDKLVKLRFFLLGQMSIPRLHRPFRVMRLLFRREIERKDISGMLVGKPARLRLDDSLKDRCTRCHAQVLYPARRPFAASFAQTLPQRQNEMNW